MKKISVISRSFYCYFIKCIRDSKYILLVKEIWSYKLTGVLKDNYLI